MNQFYKIFNDIVFVLVALILIMGEWIVILQCPLFMNILYIILMPIFLLFYYKNYNESPKNTFIFNCMMIPGIIFIPTGYMFILYGIFSGLVSDFVAKDILFKKDVKE